MASEITTNLEVWLLNQRAGTLWLKDGELQFEYSVLWLEQPQAIALSQSLPLQAKPFGEKGPAGPFSPDYCLRGNSGRSSPSSARSQGPMISAY